jgi:F-type H+-transporting ATPase subunit a
MGPMIGTPMSAISLFFMVFMNMLELLVAYIQAYVFTMLSAMFIGLAHPEHEHKEKKEIEN